MPTDWNLLFTESTPAWKDGWSLQAPLKVANLEQLKHFLDLAHIKYCLAKPYCEHSQYPVVETRELLPSFEIDPWEHLHLPGFSLVALGRPIDYFRELFQFDLLRPPSSDMRADRAETLIYKNNNALQQRLPRTLHEMYRQHFHNEDVCSLNLYPALTPFLTTMDRAQVLGMHGPHPQDMQFYLAGVYASFPSDLDTEVKRYGIRIGKFSFGDNDSYEQHRHLVLQHLMELYGYPIASERRTSAALFARRLHKMGEKFLIRTLGQSDRTLSTIWSDGSNRQYPQVEKVALVRVDDIDQDLREEMQEGGYFFDEQRHVAIVRVTYKQHKFCADNVRQERAISIKNQEVIHPLTGQSLRNVSVIRDTGNMLLRLNDIVRGEYIGRITYKRVEVVENTDTEENRLKFLYAWLAKHQRRMIGYSDEFFAQIDKVIQTYLAGSDSPERFSALHEVYQEVLNKYSYIVQARKIRVLEDLLSRQVKGARITYNQMLAEAVELLHDLKFEIVSYFDTLVGAAIKIGESMLNDRYLLRRYIENQDEALTPAGIEIKRNYGKLVTLVDDLKAIRKSRHEAGKKNSGAFPQRKDS